MDNDSEMKSVIVKEATIEEAVEVNARIPEFDKVYDQEYFIERIRDKDKLILVAYFNEEPAGYMVGYDKFQDGSFYCWMAGVNPKFRRQGVLKKLMDHGIEWAKGNAYNKIKVKTRNNRREMLAFLVKRGFMFTGVEKQPNIEDYRITLEKEI